MKDIEEKLNRFDKLLKNEDVTIEEIKSVMKENVPTFHEAEIKNV